MIPSLRLQVQRVASVTRLKPFDTTTLEGRSKERYRRIALTMTSGFAARLLAMLATLVTVPMALAYLGKEQFGLWAAITSMIVWLGLLDLGLTSGLINALAESHGRGDRDAAASYVSTAAIVLTVIAAIVICGLMIAGRRVAWDIVFAAKGVAPNDRIGLSVLAAAGAFAVGMPLAIVTQVYAAYQKAYVSNVFVAMGALITLLAVWLATRLALSLPGVILAFSAGPFLATLANGIVLTTRDMPWVRVAWSRCSVRALRRLGRTCVPLFLLQLGGLMVNQSQFFILAHVSGLSMVTDYAIIGRVIQIFAGVVLLTTAAFMPSYREALERGDRAWIAIGFKRMVLLRMTLAALFALAFLGFGNDLVRLWLRRPDIHFGREVWLALAVLLLASTWVTAHTDLLTILDRIWIQVGLVTINGVATVAITLLLSPMYGILGAVAAVAFVSVFGWTWLLPMITRSTLNAREKRLLGWT